MADTTALGVAKLHGYTVEEVTPHGRRNGFRCVPPHSKMRTFTFIADNEYDKKRYDILIDVLIGVLIDRLCARDFYA